jgi:hypothetical protein
MAKAKATKTKAKAKNPLGLAPYDPADYLRAPKEVAITSRRSLKMALTMKPLCMRSLSSIERAAACRNSPRKPASRARGCISRLPKTAIRALKQ